MLKRLAQIALIAGGLVILLMALTVGWLKAHEDELVFAAARGRQHLLTVLPADAQRVTVPEPNGVALAALMCTKTPKPHTKIYCGAASPPWAKDRWPRPQTSAEAGRTIVRYNAHPLRAGLAQW